MGSINSIRQYSTHFYWFLSFIVLFSRFIDGRICTRTSPPLLPSILVHGNAACIYSLISWWTFEFLLPSIMNEAKNNSVDVCAHSLGYSWVGVGAVAGSYGTSTTFWGDAGLFPRATTPFSFLLTVHRYSNLCRSQSTSVALFLFILAIPAGLPESSSRLGLHFSGGYGCWLSHTNKSLTLLLRKKYQFRSLVHFSYCICIVGVVLFIYCRYHMRGGTSFLSSHELAFHFLDEGP